MKKKLWKTIKKLFGLMLFAAALIGPMFLRINIILKIEIIIVAVVIAAFLNLAIFISSMPDTKSKNCVYDIYVTYAPGDIRLAQDFIRAAEQRGKKCFVSEFRESDDFLAAISGSKKNEEQLKENIEKIYFESKSFVLISSGQLKSIPPTFSGAKAIYTVTTNSDNLNLFEMSLWRYNNDRINIIICKENKDGTEFTRHTYDPAYLTIGYDYSDGEIGQTIDNLLKDLNASANARITSDRDHDSGEIGYANFLMASHKILMRGRYTPVDVYAFSNKFEDEVRRTIAEEFEGKAQTKRSGHFTLDTSVMLKILLECTDAEIEDACQEFRWEGTVCKAIFQVFLPRTCEKEQILLKSRIYADNVLICTLSTALDVEKANPKPVVETKRINRAFVSYASKDREAVLHVVEGIQHTAPWINIFLDVLSLRSGEWESQLYNEIDLSDVFYLFWSRYAKESLYVEKEWRYALVSKGLDFIEPVPLELPEMVAPPAELSQKHFNSWTLYFKPDNNIHSAENTDLQPVSLSPQQIETIAEAIHKEYSQNNPGSRYDIPWEDLTEEIKQSNREQAKRFIQHIEFLGLLVSTSDDVKTRVEQLSDEQIEILACRIHDVWAQSKKAAGWVYGQKKDNENKSNPFLIPYAEIPESEKDKDRVIAGSIVPLMKSGGVWVHKKE
ncbi:MAG: RyR domain-containing protein [Oscillospiraceae bacterium]|nr:RyR domain-containing protein [Oscillospiraceae bacterium]